MEKIHCVREVTGHPRKCLYTRDITKRVRPQERVKVEGVPISGWLTGDEEEEEGGPLYLLLTPSL